MKVELSDDQIDAVFKRSSLNGVMCGIDRDISAMLNCERFLHRCRPQQGWKAQLRRVQEAGVRRFGVVSRHASSNRSIRKVHVHLPGHAARQESKQKNPSECEDREI